MLITGTTHQTGAMYLAQTLGVRINLINLLLFTSGSLIIFFAYFSVLPIIASGLTCYAFYIFLKLTKLGGIYERFIFNRVFAVGYLMAGVAAIYANHFEDVGQLNSDAASFFDIASGLQGVELTLIELQIIHESALAIVLWRAVYDFFASLGFPRERYIGILVNMTAVALSGVVALKMTRLVFGHDPERFRRLTSLFACCGLFWLFAGIHLRDSVVLLSVTGLAYGWLHFLTKPDLGRRLLQIIALSLLAGLFFGFLRGEFMFVPIAMAMAGTAALMFGRKSRRNRLVPYMLVLVGLAMGGGMLATFSEAIQYALFKGNEDYSELASAQHGTDSLGMALIVNQAMPIRLLLGSVYLFVFPIPFWIGFQLDSAYSLFKSFNVVFFYFVVPLLGLSVTRLWTNKSKHTPAILFVLFLSLGFTFAIAGTSLETRHFGAFLAPIFVLALLPDLHVSAVRRNYKKLLKIMFFGVAIVHLAWIFLKL